jgi:ABC-type bacteriocin/lantibiotic exporter with double-glycine peptidase domain
MKILKIFFDNTLVIKGKGTNVEIVLITIFNLLESLKIYNISKTRDQISFAKKFWRFGFYASEMAHSDEGQFRLRLNENNDIEVVFKSSISIIVDTILFFLLIILSIFVNLVFLVATFLLIAQVLVEIISVKNGNIQLMRKISDKINSNHNVDFQ